MGLWYSTRDAIGVVYRLGGGEHLARPVTITPMRKGHPTLATATKEATTATPFVIPNIFDGIETGGQEFDNPKGLLRLRLARPHSTADIAVGTKEFKNDKGEIKPPEKYIKLEFEVVEVLDKPANTARYVGKIVRDNPTIKLYKNTKNGQQSGLQYYADVWLGPNFDNKTGLAQIGVILAGGTAEIRALVKEDKSDRGVWPKIIRSSIEAVEV